MQSFARIWGLELAAEGITVNAVTPGPNGTALFRANNPPGSKGEARFITGQTPHVGGGASIGKAAF